MSPEDRDKLQAAQNWVFNLSANALQNSTKRSDRLNDVQNAAGSIMGGLLNAAMASQSATTNAAREALSKQDIAKEQMEKELARKIEANLLNMGPNAEPVEPKEGVSEPLSVEPGQRIIEVI